SHNGSRVTQTFGVPPLKQETSVNLSVGLVARPASNWSLTADGYRITIADRIVISSQFQSSDPAVGAVVQRLLAPFQRLGVTTAQFFTNAVDTRTIGLDIVVTHSRTLAGGTLSRTGSANFTKTEVALGGENLFNTYPDQQVHATNVSLGRFVYSRRVTQFGMNGGFYYARLLLSL